MDDRTVRLVLVGWGAISRFAFDRMRARDIEVVGVAVRDISAPRPGLPAGATLISDPDELAALRPDVVAEAAGRGSVGPWGRASLLAGADFIVSSVSAFADAALLDSLRAIAKSRNAQVRIHPGALAGVEALVAARLMGVDAVEHRIVKPPNAWVGTDAETLCELDTLTRATTFFTGTASEAASRFPKNANVAMTTALAGVGPDATTITLIADPAAHKNRHELSARGAFGDLEVTVANSPLPTNPKSSAMAALSLVRAIENRVLPIVM